MTTPTPKTAADATKLLTELQAKRAALVAALDSSETRRKGHATSAEFGDAVAAEALRKIETEDASARRALKNLDLVIGEMQQLQSKLQASEADEAARQYAEELSAAINNLLEADDRCDAVLDQARKLLEERQALARAPILRNAKTKFAGALVIRDREIASTLLAYFDIWLSHLHSGGGYPSITRVSDWDSHHFGVQSPGQIARGPRKLTASEAAMKRATERPAPMQHGGGFDSSVEASKRKRPSDAMEADQAATARWR